MTDTVAALAPFPATEIPAIRHDWTVAEIQTIHDLPLLDLVFRAAQVHRAHNDPADIQRAALLSIKTGACPEDCAYCPQSAHHKGTGLPRERLMAVDKVLKEAAAAKAAGAHRFCMGAAWRQPKDGPEFDAVLSMVRGVRGLGMEACVTLGMLTPSQAGRLAEAGLTSYNHNLDTGPDFYGDIISTRTYEDRLNTLQNVRDAGIGVCCGGIVGMGEGVKDRAAMLQVLANHAPILRACRSTPWWPSRGPLSRTVRPWTRSISSGCAPPPAS